MAFDRMVVAWKALVCSRTEDALKQQPVPLARLRPVWNIPVT